MLKVIAVIPARWGSTRFPGKPLEPIAGKPLLQWVIEAARAAKLISEVKVATDDQRIADFVRTLNVDVIMTAVEIPSGTDRVWAAVAKLDCDVVINLQGDEPLLESATVDQLAQVFYQEPAVRFATLARPLRYEDLADMGKAKVLLDQQSHAIYFSRLPIPFTRSKYEVKQNIVWTHIGIYGFRRAALKQFCDWPVSELEVAESLEQLRVLHYGEKWFVKTGQFSSIGVDTPEDLKTVATLIGKRDAK